MNEVVIEAEKSPPPKQTTFTTHQMVVKKLKEYCENPDSFADSGPQCLFHIAKATGIGYQTLAKNIHLLHQSRFNPEVPEDRKFSAKVRVWEHVNGVWVWCGQK
jgi:hypothetical protein